MEIKVLGPGCPKCQQTEKVVKEAVSETGVAADVEKVTDVMKIAGYGVLAHRPWWWMARSKGSARFLKRKKSRHGYRVGS